MCVFAPKSGRLTAKARRKDRTLSGICLFPYLPRGFLWRKTNHIDSFNPIPQPRGICFLFDLRELKSISRPGGAFAKDRNPDV